MVKRFLGCRDVVCVTPPGVEWRVLQRAVEVMPQKVYAYEYLAVALAQVGKTGQAEDRFRQALALGTAGRITYTGLADIAQQEGRWHEAAEILRDGLIHLPKSAPILNNLAWLLATCSRDKVRDGREAVKLAERGFNDEELRKLLGLNFLRVFREVVG